MFANRAIWRICSNFTYSFCSTCRPYYFAGEHGGEFSSAWSSLLTLLPSQSKEKKMCTNHVNFGEPVTCRLQRRRAECMAHFHADHEIPNEPLQSARRDCPFRCVVMPYYPLLANRRRFGVSYLSWISETFNPIISRAEKNRFPVDRVGRGRSFHCMALEAVFCDFHLVRKGLGILACHSTIPIICLSVRCIVKACG